MSVATQISRISNEVGNQEDLILQLGYLLSGKSIREVDTTVAEGSENLITSGAVYDALNSHLDKHITLPASSPLTPGKVCTIKTNGSVTDSVEDDWFIGVTRSVSGDVATVKISGFVTVPYTGNAPMPGFQYLCADSKGGMKLADFGGRELLVTENDTVNKTITVIL